ncbi:MAG: alpha-L-fucosidase [Clostridiales bacterium]|nr:alpha-L-fucosidase [Clostridiales bacterium]
MIDKEDRMKWWREAKFGMFIHWGIYSLLGKGEWVMYNERIPVKEYEKLAARFNPVKFNADEWVQLAKEAGMKYIVITAKHHDGFSMFRTKVSDFNIVDATPFKRDPMAELAEACQREGIKLCFYYSHVREWRHPHAQSLEERGKGLLGNYGNYWDYPEENCKNLQKYIDEFDKPQLRELLTQYGPIGIIWFDTPSLIRPDQAQELADIVHELQPKCLINSRICENFEADYRSLGDCEIPAVGGNFDWETPMTICKGWGFYNQPDNRYRTTEELIHQLVDIVSMGGNYLLNVGPDAEGIIPEEVGERLKEIGRWMSVNHEAIYGTEASPFAQRPSWGRITRKGSVLYLHVYDWKNKISLMGLKNPVKACRLLADPERVITWTQKKDNNLGYYQLELELPGSAPDRYVSVLALEIEGELEVDNSIIQNNDEAIILPACLAQLHKGDNDSRMHISISGVVENWLSEKDWLEWNFTVLRPGSYELELVTKTDFWGQWDFGHKLEIMVGNHKIVCTIADDGVHSSSYQERTIKAGTVSFEKPGHYTLAIRPVKLNSKNLKGLNLLCVDMKLNNDK